MKERKEEKWKKKPQEKQINNEFNKYIWNHN